MKNMRAQSQVRDKQRFNNKTSKERKQKQSPSTTLFLQIISNN